MSLATILANWVAFTALFSVLTSASHFPNALALKDSENRNKIELIDVKCDKNEDSMQVTIMFSQPFEGIIYSQGYFNDPKCRYVSAGEGEKSYNFVVPYEGCGSKPSCAICDSVDNILIIQQDEEVQGEFDAARKISCSRTGIEEEKKIYFKPFIVDMLDVVTVPTKNGGVDCWMDIQRGIYPKLAPVGEVIKIGEALSVLVYLRDPKNEYDLSVRNCWAYDDDDFDDKKTGKVQLSDASGCTMKRKLFGTWHKTSETGSSGATLLLHNTLRAFKFPDESQVYLKCDIEICRGNCAEAICDAEEISKVDCTSDPRHENCVRNKLTERTPLGFTTLPSRIYESTTTTRITTRLPFIDTTRRPNFVYTSTQRPDYMSTTIFEQDSTTLKPLICTSDSRDIRCIQQQYPETTEKVDSTTYRESTTYSNLFKTTTIKAGLDSFCSQYPKHKRCSQRVTDDLNSNIEILTFKPPSPFVTVKSKPSIDSRNEIPSENLELIPTTQSSEILQQQLNCKGPNIDPRCPNPTGTTAPTYLPPSTTKRITVAPRCYPGSLDPRCKEIEILTPPVVIPRTRPPPVTQKTTKKLFICVPGSNDVNCDIESTKTTEEPPVRTTFTPPRNQFTTTKQPEKPICFLGSRNPECQKVSTDILTFKPRPSTTSIPPTTTKRPFISTTRAPLCYPGSSDSRCPKSTEKTTTDITETTTSKVADTTRLPICYLGSPDPRCIQLTTKKVPATFGTTSNLSTRPPISTPSIPSTTRAPICYPGSLDSRCSKPISTDIPSSTTKKPFISTTRAPLCYPGSPDPRCPKSTEKTTTDIPVTTTYKVPETTRLPICYLGSPDPRCAQLTSKKVPATFGTTSNLSTRPPISTPSIPSTTRAPICYPGSLDSRCPKPISTDIPSTTSKRPFISTTRALLCYPGSPDPRCPKQQQTTTKFMPETTVGTPETTTYKVPSTPRSPICYPGSLDPRCVKPNIIVPQIEQKVGEIPETSTYKESSTTRAPICYPGAIDPRCQKSKTTRPTIPSVSSTKVVTTEQPSASTPRCYPGSLDPRCIQATTKQPPIVNLISTTIKPSFSTIKSSVRCYPGSSDPSCASKQLVVPLKCGPGYLDPRCPNPTPTAEPATYLPPKASTTFKTQRPPITTTPVPPFTCTPNSLDPRCKIVTTTRFIPSTTSEGTTATFAPETTTRLPLTTKQPPYTTRPPFTFTTRTPTVSTFVPQCTPNSLDPRCKTFATTKYVPSIRTEGTTATFAPETTTRPAPSTTKLPTYTTRPPFSFSTFTTRTPITVSTPIQCAPNSLDPRCKTYTTPKIIPTEGITATISPETTTRFITTTSTQRPTTTRPPLTFPTFSTNRIVSSPRPFTTRITTKSTTTTENILCYPGSTIEGCKQTYTTPSFCYPGSKDPRCPQQPPSFSTHKPEGYLPPFPDARLNRVKRQTLDESDEIVKFSLSFKPFRFS